MRRAIRLASIAILSVAGVAAPAGDDAILRAGLIGSWVLAETDPAFGTIGERTIYRSDGTMMHVEFADAGCRRTRHRAEATWSIEGGVLATTTTASSDPSWMREGDTRRERIAELDAARLETEAIGTGTVRRRARSERCIAPISK